MSMMSSGNPSPPPATAPVSSLYDTRLPQLSRWRRMQIPVIAGAVIAIIRVLGPTLRFEELGMHHYRQSRARGEPVISAFWHRCIISATWYWRNRGVVVMNTTNFDGQWTRRVIEHFGFGTAQGSSTRWDLMAIPHPFSRAVIVSAPLMLVSHEADAEELERKHAEMQAALERVRDVAESWFGLSEAERERLRAEWNSGA
jgi:lysophospholipid acyltransferase (LPLAT)-like uncharacterized protein